MIEDHDAPSTSRGRKRGRKSKVEPEATMIETFDEEGLIEESEESTSGFKLEVTSQEPSSTFKEGIYNQGNFYGWTKDWNPEWMYRLPGDVVLTAIRNGGSEGRGRAEIGKCLGIDTATKPGNRRVSGHIVAVQKEHEKHVGQFQKMEGKVRMIKYFWKKSAEPETFQKLFDDFRKLAKRECPFKMGQTIKFPDTGLSTLRISDVSLRRLNDILELLSVEEILTPIHKILKHIHNKEMAQGYQFQIDKKSMMKCLLALKKENLLNIFETLVTSENVENKIQIVTRPYISSADSPEVAAEIQRTIDLYHAEGRVFPHGQLRYSTKKRTEAEKPKQPGKNEINSQLKQAQELLENGFSSGISLEQRYALFRLQNSKSIVARPKSSDQMGSSGLNETTTNEDSRIDGIDNTLDLIANSIMEETSLEKENEPTENKEDEQIDEKAAHILLNCNGVLSDGVDDPSVPMRAIPKTLEHLVRKKDLYDPHIEYGFQSKYIRLCALHDTVWHFVYGNPRGKPSVFERYPPGRDPVSLPEVSLDQLPVYQETETPYRFMPSCDYEDLPAGWFMLQDFYCALPFSVFCLLSQIPKSAPKEDVLQLLTDPIARHTPLADLPISIRKPLFQRQKETYG
ncbi:unnamed protein product, partial [Mesorhabditis belari]|uniref:GTF3C1 extended winged-helix domain-containing protein n=1 Tax=Mesorhabditis belari TaxID=2138241 RepID=A0AAF3FN04_9BILA